MVTSVVASSLESLSCGRSSLDERAATRWNGARSDRAVTRPPRGGGDRRGGGEHRGWGILKTQ